jgi:cytochrome d ubiquinol oxidase subunit II
MSLEALQTIWFFLIGVLLTGYAILDGFDLGVGFWHLRAGADVDRRKFLNAIGPVWDGNEVWLLTGGGALFAAFPPVYASVFSGFYLALVLLLACLITRAVSIEFRSKEEGAAWRSVWDTVFAVSSSVAALLLGVALGNILRGVPLTEAGDYAGTFLGLLNPYALLIGLTGLAMIATHGALYLALKTDGDLGARAKGWAERAGVVYVALWLVAVAMTVATQGHLLENARQAPVFYAVPVAVLLLIVAALLFNRQDRSGRAFVTSALAIAGQFALVGIGIYPNLVRASNRSPLSLTVFNSSSSGLTLKVMLIIALVFMPIVLAYTAFVYSRFKGKVELGPDSY